MVEKQPAIEKTSELELSPDHNTERYLTGARLHIVTIGLGLAIFLPNFEVSIVSTALFSITNDLHGFSQGTWVVTAYLLTYTGFLVIWAKISDIFGRKSSLIASLVIFIAFSAACGASQTVEQLIICRAFQGVGGSGIYALAMILFFEMVPASMYTKYAGLVTLIFAVALCLGPLLGGLITLHTTWRWVFLLNIPAGVVAAIVLFLSFPAHFPRHRLPSRKSTVVHSLMRVDVIGALLLLGGSIFIVAALQQVVNGVPWSHPEVVVFLALCGPFWISFLAWERRVASTDACEPVFPWRFVRNLVWMGMLMTTFFTGTIFTVGIISIPLRLQSVNALSPFQAGIRVLPFGIFVPVGSLIAAVIRKKDKIPMVLVLLVAAALQIVGLALLSTLPIHAAVDVASYGYEVLTGLGTGFSIGSLTMLTPTAVDPQDLVATAAINQFRLLGGSVGLAITTCVMYAQVRPSLRSLLPPAEVDMVLETASSIAGYDPQTQGGIRHIFGSGFNLQMKVAAGLAGAEVLGILVMWVGRRRDHGGR